MRHLQSVALLAAATVATAACSSSTIIGANVPGAKVFLDGEYVGTTPYTMTDTKIVGSTTTVRLEAPGYAPTTGIIKRNEEFSVGACIGGVLLLIPFLWIMDYKSTHMFDLQPGAGGGAGPGPAPVNGGASGVPPR